MQEIAKVNHQSSRLKTVRIFGLPCPHVPAHILQGQLRLEAQLLFSES